MSHFLSFALLRGSRSRRGVSAMEYGLLAALVALATVTGVQRIGAALNDLFERTAEQLAVADEAVATGAGSPSSPAVSAPANRTVSTALVTVNQPFATLTVSPVRRSSDLEREMQSYRENLERASYGRVLPTACARPPCNR